MSTLTHICSTYKYPRVPNFNLLHSKVSRFRVTGHFETSAMNDPKNYIEHHKVQATTYILLVLLSNIFAPFFLTNHKLKLKKKNSFCEDHWEGNVSKFQNLCL